MDRYGTDPSSELYGGGSVDVVVVGAGLIGMTIALEMHRRGASVAVIDRGRGLLGASTAAAGMLAVDDPHNPTEMRALSRLSAALYPGFLARMEALSGVQVPFQTETTVQYLGDGTSTRLDEHSLDPRQLAKAVRGAVQATSVRLLESTSIVCTSIDEKSSAALRIMTSAGGELRSKAVVYAAGAWTASAVSTEDGISIPVTPRKGQMLRVRIPAALEVREVHRNEHVYIVPRLTGSQAGTALIGATVEDAGFDMTLRAGAVSGLRCQAAAMLPALGSETEAPLVESWASLRPATPDALPVIGALPGVGRYIASGHYRNGILLAPATAQGIADLLEGKMPAVDLAAFSAARFL